MLLCYTALVCSLSTSITVFSNSLLVHTTRFYYNHQHYFPRLGLLNRRTMASSAASVIIDKSQFNKSIKLIALKIPSLACSEYLKVFEPLLFKRPRTKRIYNVENEPQSRLILLSDTFKDMTLQSLPPELKAFNSMHSGQAVEYDFLIDYDHYAADDALKLLLPGLKEVPSSFEQAGHIAHVNLRDDAIAYKHIIGKVLLDKNPTIKTVVNKISSIGSEFRTFPLEVIAGDHNLEVSLKESGARFSFNFANVYWNSRLQMEHLRLISIIRKTSARNLPAPSEPSNTTTKYSSKPLVVADMMAGVGPFAVPLTMQNAVPATSNDNRNARGKQKAKFTGNSDKPSDFIPPLGSRPIIAYANDLNPASYKYLCQNAQKNHCSKRLIPYNMDGRAFILKLLGEDIVFHEVIMNLPQTATDFLDVFVGMATRLGARYNDVWGSEHTSLPLSMSTSSTSVIPEVNCPILPRIHVYGFSTHETDPVNDITKRVAGVLRCPVDVMKAVPDLAGHIVRDVAPNKVMVCLSFTLPRQVASAKPLDFPDLDIPIISSNSCTSKETNDTPSHDDSSPSTPETVSLPPSKRRHSQSVNGTDVSCGDGVASTSSITKRAAF